MATNNGQIDWIAALNGMSTQEYLDSMARGQAVEAAQDPDNGATAIPGAIWDAGQADDAYVRQVTGATPGYVNTLNGISSQLSGLGPASTARAQQLQGINNGLGAQSWSAAQTANAGNTAALGSYGQAIGNAGAWDLSNFNNFQNAANAPMQMTASGYVGDAMSNPADVARQMQVFSQLQGAANGSLNVQSQAANAYADAGDIANQRAAAYGLQRAGQGSLDVDLNSIRELDNLRDPSQIQGMSQLMGMANGSQDIRVGQLDPESYAAMVDARNQLKGLTTPGVTDAERLMYEMSRRQQEQDESAVRAALDTQAQRRGSYGAGSSIARSALGAQQTSQNRMLQDMQANAQAQQRAMQALQGYGTLSSNMSAQANDLAARNQATRAGALGQYTGITSQAANTLGQIGASNAMQNRNRQLQAQQMASQAYAELRAQGFNEAYARGRAADIVNSANSDRQLGAMGQSAQLASSMRNSSDAMSMFNQGQRQQQSQFADNYAANRQDAQFGRQQAVWNAGNTVGRNYVSDQTGLFNATTNTNQNNFNNTQNSIATQQGLNNDWMSAFQNADNTAIAAGGLNRGIAQDAFNAGNEPARLAAVAGRQKVQDATTIRNLAVNDRANRAQLATLQGGSWLPSNDDPSTPTNATTTEVDQYGQVIYR